MDPERRYIPSGDIIEKINYIALRIPEARRNNFLRQLSESLLAHQDDPDLIPENPLVVIEPARKFLGLDANTDRLNQMTKFLLGFLQLSPLGKKEVIARIDSMIDPDISQVPDSI